MSHHNPRTQANILAGALIAVTGCATSADVITVGPSTGVETNPIQAAIELASDGDVIRVAPGIYTGVDSDQVIDLMGKAITLRAIEGPESTIIDGEGVRRVILCSSLESPSTVIEGFTIRNGEALIGSGLLAIGSSPTLLDCTFESNAATNRGGAIATVLGSPSGFKCRFIENGSEEGGAIHLSNQSSLSLAHCTFEGNTAVMGGGIYNVESRMRITDCAFTENHASEEGGAVYEFNANDTETRNCVFTRNESGYIGGAIALTWSRCMVFECRFESNKAQWSGGGIELHGFCAGAIRNSVFTDNEAQAGGGVSGSVNRPMFLTNCRFNSNNADFGESIRFWGNYADDPVIRNTEFCNEGDDPISGQWTDGGGNAFGVICPDFCVTDLNNDLRIDGSDLRLLFGAWLSDDTVADITGDGIVDGADLNRVLEHWGSCGGQS